MMMTWTIWPPNMTLNMHGKTMNTTLAFPDLFSSLENTCPPLSRRPNLLFSQNKRASVQGIPAAPSLICEQLEHYDFIATFLIALGLDTNQESLRLCNPGLNVILVFVVLGFNSRCLYTHATVCIVN